MNDGKTGVEGSYYQKVRDGEVITELRNLLASGAYRLRDSDGKIEITTPAMSWDTPWHHISHDAFMDCQTWHRIMFDLFSATMPDGGQFVPSACQQCWKVVVRPKTLIGLFALLELQKSLMRPSKCGIEVRSYVHGLYGGYFYNHSLEEGLMCHELVRGIVDRTDHLGSDTPVILKRACTEFEKLCGPSDKWVVSEKQIYIETLVKRCVVKDDVIRDQPDHAIAYVHRKWIEWAYANGDPTYSFFTNGEPLHKPYVTYHHLTNARKSTRDKAFDKFKRVSHFGYDL